MNFINRVRNFLILSCSVSLIFPTHLIASQRLVGQPNWDYKTNSSIASSPAYYDGMIFIGSNDKNLYAINASTGILIWKYATNCSIESSPAISDNLVFFGSEDQNLYAVNIYTGQQVWVFATQGEIHSSPAISQDRVYVGSDDNSLYAINTSTGKEIWNFFSGGVVYSSPFVNKDSVFFGSYDFNHIYNRLYSLDAYSGKELWNYTATGGIRSSPTTSTGLVFVGSDDHNLYALNSSNGKLVWNYLTNGRVFSSPYVNGSSVFVGSDDGNLYAVKKNTGEKLWEYLTNGPVQSSPTVQNGVVFFGSNDKNLYALDATSGEKLWDFTTGGLVFSSPLVLESSVFVGSYDEHIYSIDAFQSGTSTTDMPLVIPYQASGAAAAGVSIGSLICLLAASSPTQLGQASRGTPIFQILSNDGKSVNKNIQTWFTNPTHLRIGNSNYSYELGTVVGNWAIFSGVAILWTGASISWGAERVRYPGGLILPTLFLITPTTVAETVLMKHGNRIEQTIGGISMMVQVIGIGSLIFVLHPSQFRAVWNSEIQKWQDPSGSNYIAHYGLLFEKYSQGRQGFVCVELITSTGIGITRSFLNDHQHYPEVLTSSFAISLIYALSMVLLRPDNSRSEHFFYGTIAAIESSALLTQTIASWVASKETQNTVQTFTEAAAMAAQWALLLKSTFDLRHKAKSILIFLCGKLATKTNSPTQSPLIPESSNGDFSSQSYGLDQLFSEDANL